MTRLARFTSVLAAAIVATAAAQADTLLVVRKSADAVDFIDPGSGIALASVPVGHAPHEIAVSPDGRRAVVSNYGTREQPGRSLSVLDLEQAQELRQVDLGEHTRPHGVAWLDDARAVVTAEGSGHVLVVDADAGKLVAARPTQQQTSHMVAVSPKHPGLAYVGNVGSGSVSAVELEGAAAPRSIATGAGSEGIAVRPDGREIWVAARSAGAISVLDARSLEPLARLEVPGIPIRVMFDADGRTAYVSCAGASAVVAIDVESRRERGRHMIDAPPAADTEQRPTSTFATGSAVPVGLALARDGRTLFVAATMADRVLQLDASTLEPLRSIEVAGEPDGLGVTAVRPKARCHACANPAAFGSTDAGH